MKKHLPSPKPMFSLRQAGWFQAMFGRCGERGMAIAEYAIGILIVIALGLVITGLVKSDMKDRVFDVIDFLLERLKIEVGN
jgi:hypothetical protein